MAVNTLTAFLLLSIQKPLEAIEFIMIAERIVYRLIEQSSKNKLETSPSGTTNVLGQQDPNNPLEVVGETGFE